MKRFFGLTQLLFYLALFAAATPEFHAQNAQQLVFAGLRAVAGNGQFNSIQTDSAGDLYLLLDQKDGVRILKTDPGATQIYAQALLGTAGDIGIAMALDPQGDVYVTGTTTSGNISGTSGAAFPARADSTTNSFVAKFDSALNPLFVTYAGSGRMAATGIAATEDAVFITGSIFASTLPVTSSAIIPSPAPGTTGNGFVERFNSTGTTLIYATYLSGFGGDTSPAAIAADSSDNAYIAGYTTASGYPTLSAVVPSIIGASSGFLTKLAPTGDSITFSTFIPGNGITSLALDTASQDLLFAGSIALGEFPVASVAAPLVTTGYQAVVRMPLDGSRVIASTLLAPGAAAIVTPAPNGTVWAAVPLQSTLLPLPAISDIGNTAAFRINSQGNIDNSIRLGGSGLTYSADVAVNIASIAVDSSGQPIFAGNASLTTSASQLATQTFDLPLFNSPTAVLPSTVRDAVLPAGTNCGSLCTGSGAYLVKVALTAGPALALSTDTAPNITLHNLGSQPAINLQLSGTGFTLNHNCPSTLGAGAECNILLQGNGPGMFTAQAANASTQTVNVPVITKSPTALVVTPSEIDFGIITAGDPPSVRTVTLTNLNSTAQTFPSLLLATNHDPNSPFAVSTDCPNIATPLSIAPGASCHLIYNASVPFSGGNLFSTAGWSFGNSSLNLSVYEQLTPLNLSASQIEFGTQYSTSGSLRLPRYLYLSNNSAAPIQHAHVALSPSSVFAVSDLCPSVLEPHTVCQLKIDYTSPTTSADSVTLTLDQGLSVLITGRTEPEPGAGGATTNPSLAVTPAALTFANSVLVTSSSSNSQTATIANTGAQPFPLSFTLTGDFTQSNNCPSVLAAGASCSVVIAFAPSQPGTRQGMLSVSSGTGITPAYVNLTGTGTAILAANNGTLDLGSTTIGQPVVQWTQITQPFTQFTATTGGDFAVLLVEDIGYGHGQPPASSFTPIATSSCTNCWLGVQFLPTAAGTATASLALASSSSGNPYTISLTGNGLPLTGLLLTPAQQDFGPVAVHSSSAPTLFTLTNLTPTTANLSAPVLTGDFVLSTAPTGGRACSGPLAPNASCFLQAVYSPSTTGPVTGALSISSGTATASAALSAYGSPDTGLSLNPDALIFRNVPDPISTQQTITVSNTGIYNLQIGTPASDNASFTSSTTCAALSPGATCTITVTYIPSTATAAGTLSIPITSSAAGSPTTTCTVALTGAYTSEDAGLQIIPSQTIYGPAPTSTFGLTRQFTINNLTAKQLTLALSMPRQFVLTEPPCITLEPNGSCNFSVAFLPLTNGDVTGTAFAQATAADSSAPLNALGYVEGFGIGSGKLSVTGPLLPGDLLSFGQVPSGQTSTRTLTLTNTGTVPMTVRRITSEWPFLATTSCGITLTPSASCTVTLTYAPQNQAPAGSAPAPFSSDAGTLVIESDAASSPDFIDLSGTVTPVTVNVPSNAAPLVSYTTSDNSLSFPATSGGNVSAPRMVTITNTGTTTIHVTGLITTSDFAVAGSCSTIVPGASCPITVTFTPQASSSQTLTTVVSALEINSDAGTPLNFISLLGTATPSILALSPAALDFGAVLVGTSAALPIQITNGSSSAAIFSGITATGDYNLSGNCPAAGSQLAPGGVCTLQVTFTPTQAGTRKGTISVATSITSLPLTVNLTGVGAQSHLQATPSSLAFSNTTIGGSTSLTLSLANTGTAPVSRLAFVISGDYSITSACAATTLAPGATCAVNVTFLPTAAGARSGNLTITSSDPGSPLTVPLTGTALPAGAFSLTVDGNSASSITVVSGRPANYNLTIAPQNGYIGTVVLNCTGVSPGQYATCSLLPSSITLGSTGRNHRSPRSIP